MKSEEYDRWFDSKAGQYCWSLESQLIREMLALKADQTLLDIGCGTGRFLQMVASPRAVGVDQSTEMLSRA